MRIIGDVHGKIAEYEQLLSGLTIQLGDLGFNSAHDRQLYRWNICSKHYVVFGNHDYYPYVNQPYSLNGCYEFEGYRVACIRGANSIDKAYRVVGQDWFAEEEQSYSELSNLIADIVKFKPDIIISHDCPQWIAKDYFGIKDLSRTRQALQVLSEMVSPQMWVFGHHHKSMKVSKCGVDYRCLTELEFMEIEKGGI